MKIFAVNSLFVVGLSFAGAAEKIDELEGKSFTGFTISERSGLKKLEPKAVTVSFTADRAVVDLGEDRKVSLVKDPGSGKAAGRPGSWVAPDQKNYSQLRYQSGDNGRMVFSFKEHGKPGSHFLFLNSGGGNGRSGVVILAEGPPNLTYQIFEADEKWRFKANGGDAEFEFDPAAGLGKYSYKSLGLIDAKLKGTRIKPKFNGYDIWSLGVSGIVRGKAVSESHAFVLVFFEKGLP